MSGDFEPRIDAYAATIPADYHPERNEDAKLINRHHQAFGVFDGVGKFGDGDIAAQLAARSIEQQLPHLPNNCRPAVMAKALRALVMNTNSEILNHASGRGMGTTMTLAKLFTSDQGELTAAITSVGDSRAYLFRNEHLNPLTVDHTPIRQEHGREYAATIQNALSDFESKTELTNDEFLAFFHRHIISSYLGRPAIEIESTHLALKENDLLLLTTDGIHDNLNHSEMQRILQIYPAIDAATALTRAALSRSRDAQHDRAKSDDMTAVVVSI